MFVSKERKWKTNYTNFFVVKQQKAGTERYYKHKLKTTVTKRASLLTLYKTLSIHFSFNVK